MKRSRKNPWADHYTRRAQKDRYAARSAYKLQEIQKKYGVLAKGAQVLDLGCAPGSWLQFASTIVGPGGYLVGVDRSPLAIRIPDNATVLTSDVADLQPQLIRLGRTRFNTVLSDMAPATTGHRQVDEARSVGLCETALSVAEHHLVPGGHFVCKIFQGGAFNAFADQVRACFHKQTAFRPKSTRKASREVFIIALGKR